MQYQAIIFDMDGTIVSTEHVWHNATKNVFEKRGIKFTQELEKEFKQILSGLAPDEITRIIKEVGKLDISLEQIAHERETYAYNVYEQEVCFIDGFLEFYKQVVTTHNLKVGVATNAPDKTVARINKKLDLKKLFEHHIYTISDVNNVGKPDPTIYLHAAEQLGVAPENCVTIEDTPSGIDAAQGAGMFCIGINSGNDRKRIEHAAFVIDHYDEIDLERLLKK